MLVLGDAGVEDEEVDAVVARAERLRQVADLVLLGLCGVIVVVGRESTKSVHQYVV